MLPRDRSEVDVLSELYVPPGAVELPDWVDAPDWFRRDVSLPAEPVVLVLPEVLDCATAVAAPSNTAIADATNMRRLEGKEWFGFIAA